MPTRSQLISAIDTLRGRTPITAIRSYDIADLLEGWLDYFDNDGQISPDTFQAQLTDIKSFYTNFFETLSIADGVGVFNASTGIGTIRDTAGLDVNFTVDQIPNLPKGKYLDLVVPGTSSVTGVSRVMEEGILISRGTKWDFVPKSNRTNEKLNTIEGRFEHINLANPAEFSVDGFLMYGHNGATAASAAHGYTGFMKVTAGKTYSTGIGNSGFRHVTFFNAARAVVSGGYVTTTKKVEAPVGVEYVIGTYFLVDKLNLMFSEATTEQAYLPYKTVELKGVFVKPSALIQTPQARLTSDNELGGMLPKTDIISKTTFGKNLANPAEYSVDGSLMNGHSGLIEASANYFYTGKIKVDPGGTYTGKGVTATMRHITYFDVNGNVIPNAGFTAAVKTVTLPLTVYYIVASVHRSDRSTFQFEKSAAETSFEAYKAVKVLESVSGAALPGQLTPAQILDLFPKSDDIIVSITGTEEIELSYKYEGAAIKEVLRAFRTASIDTSQVFDWKAFYVNGELIRSTGDDATPVRILGATVGANHGYVKYIITMAAHGKSHVDVGSVWSDGTKQFVLLSVLSATRLEVTSRLGSSQLSGTTLTHVSGATNTAVINTASNSSAQIYPSIRNYKLQVLIDGKEITDITTTRSISGKKEVAFLESYEVMSKSSMVEWLITQVGTPTPISVYAGSSVLAVGNSYVFNSKAGCTIYAGVTALANISEFQDLMFVMGVPMAGSYSYYIPGSKEFTHEGKTYNFTNVTSLAGVALEGRIGFTTERLAATGPYGDRALLLRSDIGLAMGYLPVQSTAMEVRRANANRKALEVSTSRKVYMSGIDSTGIASMVKGQTYSTIAYKNWFFRKPGRTAMYDVPSKDHRYIYIDWHITGLDTIPMPTDLSGKSFAIIAKTDNVTVMTPFVTSSIVVEIATGSNYAFLVLRFDL
jgi:hypothetical protein